MVYTVVFEQSEDGNWGAYVPDLPGVVAGAPTQQETEQLIREGIVFHVEGLKAKGLDVPKPSAVAMSIEVAA